MRETYAILRNTFHETVRQPVFGVILILTCVGILAIPLSSAHVYTFGVGTSLENSAQRMVAEFGLSTILLSGLLLAVFSASGVINREIEEKTALTVLSKSVSRPAFILGKFLGIAGAITLAIASYLMLLLMTVRFGANTAAYQPIDFGAIGGTLGAVLLALGLASFRNYFSGKSWIGSFTVSLCLCLFLCFSVLFFFDAEYNFAITEEKFGAYDWQAALAGLLTLEAIILLCAVAVAASTRLGAAGNFCVCTVAFVGGLTGPFVYENYGAYLPARIWYALVPNLQSFWMSEALKREIDIPLSYVAQTSQYAAVYLLAMLCLAAFMFDRREIA